MFHDKIINFSPGLAKGKDGDFIFERVVFP